MQQQGGLTEWPDKDLVVAYKGGIPEAYDEMYRRYSARVYGVCRRMLGNSEDAREATQETFLKAFQALPRFNGEYKLGAWLARIASNVCVDHIRRRGRGAILTPLDSHHEPTEVELGPEDTVIKDAPALSMLENIQPLHARALRLRNLEGFSHKEIAAQLGMSPMQVKALLHRARLSFKRAWENASGWALAPLIGVRQILHHGSKDAGVGAQLPMWTQTAAPLLAERVAASAMVVVVALSGSGGSPPGTEGVPPGTSVSSDEFPGAERRTALTVPSSSSVAAADKPALVAQVDQLLAVVRDTAEGKTKDKQQREKDDSDDDGFDPGSPDQSSRKLLQEVHDVAEDVGDALPRR